jgi:hypothetical protein
MNNKGYRAMVKNRDDWMAAALRLDDYYLQEVDIRYQDAAFYIEAAQKTYLDNKDNMTPRRWAAILTLMSCARGSMPDGVIRRAVSEYITQVLILKFEGDKPDGQEHAAQEDNDTD